MAAHTAKEYMYVHVWLTVNSPVLGSNPTCTVCSKSTGEEISGRIFSVKCVCVWGGGGGGREREGKLLKRQVHLTHKLTTLRRSYMYMYSVHVHIEQVSEHKVPYIYLHTTQTAQRTHTHTHTNTHTPLTRLHTLNFSHCLRPGIRTQ